MKNHSTLPLAVLAGLALFVGASQADVVYSSEDFEGGTVGELATSFDGTDYTNTAVGRAGIYAHKTSVGDTSNDPTGQHAGIRGDANKHFTLTNPMTLVTDGVTSAEVTFAINFGGTTGVYKTALLYSASGNFDDSTTVAVFDPALAPYGTANQWYVNQVVTFGPGDVTGGFTDAAKLRWAKGPGATGMSTRIYLDDIVITGIGGSAAATFQLTITPNGADYDFSWGSQAGKVYDLVSSTDLATPIASWPVYAGNADIPSGGATTSVTGIAPADPTRFFAVVGKDPPPPPLQNGSFEDPVTAEGPVGALGSPWTEYDPGTIGSVGTLNPTTADYPAEAPDGQNVGNVSFTYMTTPPGTAFGISQALGATFAADTDYQVTVRVGRTAIAGWAWPGYRVELWAGATLLAADDDDPGGAGTTPPAAGAFMTSTVGYDHTSGSAATPGDTLEVRLLSRGGDPESAGDTKTFDVDFDSVTFSATPTVP